VLVHLLLAQVGHDAGLAVRGTLHSVANDPVEIGIHCALVHLHDLLVQALLSSPDYVLRVPPSGLFDLPIPPLVLSLFHLLLNLFLLSSPHQFLGQLVQGLCDDLSLQSLVHRISKSVLVLLQ
jgi:hypothetical protein